MTEVQWMKMFGDNLQTLLDERHLTKSELSKLTGITKGAISRYVAGKQMPTIRNAMYIADAFRITLDELVYFGDSID